MRRRRLFRSGAAALSLAAAPGWIRRAFADVSPAPPAATPADVAAARQRAFARKRPLAVIVVPDEGVERPARGRAWGAFLNHAAPAELAPLALADVICARLKDLELPSGGKPAQPWLVVLADGQPPRAFDGKVPAVELGSPEHRQTWDKQVDAQIAALARLVKEALAPPGSPALTKRHAEEALVLRKQAPPGSRWDEDWDCPPCGMAMTPYKSRRFLTFLVKGEEPPTLPFPHLVPDHDHDKH